MAKGIKYTNETFIQAAKDIHGDKYDYSKVEYKGLYQKVCIICRKHGEFWQTPGNHLDGRGCKLCQIENMRLTTEQFIEEARKVHGDYYNYDKTVYTTGRNKVIITCPVHGDLLVQANNHLRGAGCRKCHHKVKVPNKITLKVKDTESFIREAIKIHGDKYDYSKVNYINKKTKVIIICPIHGEFLLTPDDHIHKPSGCPLYGHNVYTNELFIEKCKQIHNNKYTYEKTIYTGVRNDVIITCPEHGDFIQRAHSHLSGAGCPLCVLKSQQKIFTKLTNRFPKEHWLFEVNKDVVSWLGQQRLDIYLPKYNLAIEYDGQQHFMAIETFGGEKRFETQKKLDAHKNLLCKQNNCILFRIPYNYTEEYFENICSEILKIITDKSNLIGQLEEKV